MLFRFSRTPRLRLLFLLVGAASLVLPAVAVMAGGEDGCINDWSIAAPIVSAEGLATVEAVTEAARGHVEGDIVKLTLCREGGVYIYRLLVRTPAGQHRTVRIDAKEPFKDR